jgi:hypothetical protein
MKILTIGPSPTLLTQCGKINQCLLKSLTSAGHEVASLVWHHDIEYFLPTETNRHNFTFDTQKVPLFPFLGAKGQLASFAFETMKEFQPQAVITIGDYHEVEFVQSIKALYGGIFKWLAIITYGGNSMLPESGLNLSYADALAVTTKTGTAAAQSITGFGEYVPFGVDLHEVKKKTGEFKILNMGKNSQMSNVPALIEAAALANIKTTLHTNLHDVGGDYDMEYLTRRTYRARLFSLPKRFVSIKDGYTDAEITEQYESHHVIVDCSLQSQTALTMLEGMSHGCIPIGMMSGAMGEVLAEMPEWCRFVVPHVEMTLQRGEKACVINPKDLARTLMNISVTACDSDWFGNASLEAAKVTKNFTKETFASRIKEMLETILTCKHSIVVDSF